MPDWDIISPPASMTVDHDNTPRLYLADGTPLVRQAGFTAGDRMRHVQTSGTNPPLHDNTQRRPPKKGKR
jgi:hypothetical protein